jgi:hypothetical protein
MRDVLRDGPGEERDGATVEAGLDALEQVARQFLLVGRDLVLVLARARIGLLLFAALGARLLGLLLCHRFFLLSSGFVGCPGPRPDKRPASGADLRLYGFSISSIL